MVSLNHVVVVGASLAGLRAVEALRGSGYDGRLTLIGGEAHLPYDRPPLSKELLSGAGDVSAAMFRSPHHFSSLDVDLMLGTPATGVDFHSRRVATAMTEVQFEGLIVATGAAVRRLDAGHQLEGVHVLRTLDDLVRLRADFDLSPKVVVVGAGFIGAEVASSARARGLEVVVVEAADQPLARVVGAEFGSVCAALHLDNGVRLLSGVGVVGLQGSGRVSGVRLSSGDVIAADVVVVGIGVVPATSWVEGSGLEVRDGIVCDEYLNVGVQGVYAAGDVARWPNRLFGEEMRVEHWTNAAEQGASAARNLVAGSDQTRYEGVPYFWSDQYGARIQVLGRTRGECSATVRGTVEARKFLTLVGARGAVVGAMAMNMPKLLMSYRSLIARRASWEHALEVGRE